MGLIQVTIRSIMCGRLEEERRNPAVDLRAYRLFEASGDYEVDCCPSFTQRNRRTFAINRQGLVIELFQTANFTQTFYETVCSNESSSHEADGAGVATVEDGGARPPSCKFIDPLFAPRSRCVQQWSYVYAIGRLFGRRNQQFSLDYVRIPTGCKCQVSFGAVAAVRVEHYGPPNRTSRAARDDKI